MNLQPMANLRGDHSSLRLHFVPNVRFYQQKSSTDCVILASRRSVEPVFRHACVSHHVTCKADLNNIQIIEGASEGFAAIRADGKIVCWDRIGQVDVKVRV